MIYESGWNDHGVAVQALITQMIVDAEPTGQVDPVSTAIQFGQRSVLRALSERITRLTPHDDLPTIQCRPTSSDAELQADRDLQHADEVSGDDWVKLASKDSL